MLSDQPKHSVKISQENYNVLKNQIQLSLAQRESLIKSWTASSSHLLPPAKTQEEVEADDASLFHNQSLYLGIGASIPSDLSANGADRDIKSLRAKILGLRNLAPKKVEGSKKKIEKSPRDDSSDDDLGRSSLGRMKKQKLGHSGKDSDVSQKETLDNPHKIRDIKMTSCTSQLSCSSHAEIRPNLANSELQVTENDCNDRGIPCQFQSRNSLTETSNLYLEVHIKNTPINLNESSKPKIPTHEKEDLNREDLDEKKRRKKREKKKRQKLKAKVLRNSFDLNENQIQ